MPTIDNWRALQEQREAKLLDERDTLAQHNASLLADAARLTAEQQVLREWIAEALPVLASIDSEGECHAVNSEATLEFLRALRESGRKLVEGGPDDLLAGV